MDKNKILETLGVKPGDKIKASDWNTLLDQVIEASNIANSVEYRLSHVEELADNLSMNKTKYDLLWEGNAYKSGTSLKLQGNLKNYDAIFVENTFAGTTMTMLKMEGTSQISIRGMNLADSDTSTTTNFYEMRLKRVGDSELELTGNKQLNYPSNAITIDPEAQYISRIYGIKF